MENLRLAHIAQTLQRNAGLFPDQDEIEETAAALSSIGVEVLADRAGSDAPSRLGRGPAWDFLTLLGHSKVLESPRIVGIVGRRNASDRGLQFAHDLAAALAHEGIPTLSGLARGIDRAAHQGSLEAGGSTIGVIPEGILRFLNDRRGSGSPFKPSCEAPLLLVSGVSPWTQWSVAEAMRRNRWIAAWSDLLVVVEADSEGGTWKTAAAASQLGRPLWVAAGLENDSEGLGNEALAHSLVAMRLDARAPIQETVAQLLSL